MALLALPEGPDDELDEFDASAPNTARGRGLALVTLFTLTSFVASTLVFSVQPLVGRLLLPLAGGSAGLWNTALVFFQGALLGGYLLAHVLSTKVGGKGHLVLQLGLLLLPLLVLPLTVPAGWDLTSGNPALVTLAVLSLMVGLPFLALSTASPTLQKWFSLTGHADADDPYFLYAAGNVGSIVALLGYPLVIEPRIGLDAQTRLFAGAYLVLIGLFMACAMVVFNARGETTSPKLRLVGDDDDTHQSTTRITWARRGRWIGLAAVPSALLLGVTRYLATDVASFPLLWVVPLVLYLLTFVIAFGRPSPKLIGGASSVVRVLGIGLVLSFVGQQLLIGQLAIHLSWFFAATLYCHLRLAEDRPPVERLTEFYSWVSTGGVVGGATVALLAPVLFDRVWEYPLAIVITVALTIGSSRSWGHPATWLIIAAIVAVGYSLQTGGSETGSGPQLAALVYGLAGIIAFLRLGRSQALAGAVAVILVAVVFGQSGQAVFRDRSFFGTYAVQDTAEGDRLLFAGTTIHGRQLAVSPDQPTSYYHPAGPLGDVLGGLSLQPQRVSVIGLGAGELVAYGSNSDSYSFIEIDPKVVEIAEDPELFTYLSDAEADVETIVGDGRIELARMDGTFDAVIVDAFSSDAIPIHLVTIEAIDSYLQKAPDGVVMVHITNRHFDLEPVLAGISAEIGVDGYIRRFFPDPQALETGAFASTWVLLDPSGSFEVAPGWRELGDSDVLWTDDYANLLGVWK